jgi:hypothetical protein
MQPVTQSQETASSQWRYTRRPEGPNSPPGWLLPEALRAGIVAMVKAARP